MGFDDSFSVIAKFGILRKDCSSADYVEIAHAGIPATGAQSMLELS
jgi:hypothetical protein